MGGGMSGGASQSKTVIAWGVSSVPTVTTSRFQKEMSELSMDLPLHGSAGPKGDHLYHWVSTFIGPRGTPYQGGIYFLDILFPADYLFKPPKVVFKTRIYHCNVHTDC